MFDQLEREHGKTFEEMQEDFLHHKEVHYLYTEGLIKAEFELHVAGVERAFGENLHERVMGFVLAELVEEGDTNG